VAGPASRRRPRCSARRSILQEPAPVAFEPGQVVRRTLQALAADLPTYGLLALILVALPTALQAWFQIRMTADAAAHNPLAVIADLAWLLAGLLASWIMNSLANAAAIKAAMARIEDRPMGFGAAIGAGAPHVPSLMLIDLWVGACVAAGSVLLIFPGFIMISRWAVAVPVRIVEGRAATASMARSARLTEGHRWPLFALIAGFGAGVLLVQGLLMVLAIGPMDMLDPDKRRIASYLLAPVVQLFTFPASAVGLAVMYAELHGPAAPQATAAVFS
jgi:hypothetical protein